MPAEELEVLFKVLEGGKAVAESNIVKFPVDAAGAGAATSLAGQGVSTAVELGNGTATAVSQLTVLEGGAAASATSGIGILAMDVGVAGAAIAPALGVLAGVGLYNLAPEFWTNVSNKLIEAGQTVGGKVRAFLNGSNKQAGFSETTIEIFKQAFLEAGLYNSNVSFKKYPETYEIEFSVDGVGDKFVTASSLNALASCYSTVSYEAWGNPKEVIKMIYLQIRTSDARYKITNYLEFITLVGSTLYRYTVMDSPIQGENLNVNVDGYGIDSGYQSEGYIHHLIFDANGKHYDNYICIRSWPIKADEWALINGYYIGSPVKYPGNNPNNVAMILWLLKILTYPNAQPDATFPEEVPFPQTYPEWHPWDVPDGIPTIYPVELPQVNPYPNQQQAQEPSPEPDPDKLLEALLDLLPNPTPNPNPNPQPDPAPDPDPQPEPEPIPEPDPVPLPDPDPVNPNPPPTPSPPPTPIVPPMSIATNKLFTVYNPTIAELNGLGGFLWSEDIVSQLLKMWQDPLDGIISLQIVYATPSIGSLKSIVLGYLNTGIVAPVVISQFSTIDCGTLDVPELKKNATDYTPYIDINLYLPFVGFVELDPNDFVNGKIRVVYNVDMYTGTCLATIYSIRSADMPSGNALYQFSGNASQQIPLTSGSANGLISALVSVVGTGVAVASGGALGVAGAALSAGHSLTHEMLHVGRSGSLSANAGIMGSRKPALIIGRRHGYDANGYNELYGYPANKTIYLGNTNGFTRVKAGRLRTKATQNEKDEIMDLLKKGVIL